MIHLFFYFVKWSCLSYNRDFSLMHIKGLYERERGANFQQKNIFAYFLRHNSILRSVGQNQFKMVLINWPLWKRKQLDFFSFSENNITCLQWGKMIISNAGISIQVFRKPPGAPGSVRVPPGPGRVSVVDGQVRISKSPFSNNFFRNTRIRNCRPCCSDKK